MGTVHLTKGHHGLYIRTPEPDLERRVLLTKELLDRPIWNGDRLLSESTTIMTRGALEGLMRLVGFNVAVSYGVVERDGVPHISQPHRVWGEIMLRSCSTLVVKFSHDTRYDNRAFYVLAEWLEDEGPGGELDEEEYARFAEEWSSPAKWHAFFEARIRRQIELEQTKGIELREKALHHLSHASNIHMAFLQRVESFSEAEKEAACSLCRPPSQL